MAWMTVLAVAGVLAVQDPADAYRDAQARDLVEAARVRRRTVDVAIERYRAEVRERISAGLRAAGQERLVYRRESAARIDWRRDGPVQVDVIGAREAIPPALDGIQVPESLQSYMGHLAFDPVGGEVLLPLDSRAIRHPLAEGAESTYRYTSGDTTEIRLADGRVIQLVELRIEPRRGAPELITGSFWFDSGTHDLVRMVFRPAASRPLGGVFALSAAATLDRVTIEYGLWDLVWWMPRRIWAEGSVRLGSLARAPLSYEREYADYTVEGDSMRLGEPAEAVSRRPCRPRFSMAIRVGRPPDSTRRRPAPPDTTRTPCDREFLVTVPTDSAGLLYSSALPPSIWIDGPAIVTAAERAAAADAVLPEPPWQIGPKRLALPIGGLRYNRVEGLSPQLAGALELGRASLEGSVRMGTADRVLNADVGLIRRTGGVELGVRAYRRLAVIDPSVSVGLGASASALIFGSDNGDYYRARGVELTGRHRPATGPDLDWRFFAERQRSAPANTDFNLRHLVDEDFAFRPTIAASPATQYGASARLDLASGLYPGGWTWGLVFDAEAAVGTFDYVRPAILGRVTGPVAAGLLGMLEVEGGIAAGSLPPQRHWLLGGVAKMRAVDPATLNGDAFWRARAELATAGPRTRLVVFNDWGWAGSRDRIAHGRPLVSVGVGVTFLDGLVRIDLARALRAPVEWGFHPRFNAPL